jgi:uncharacterized repeat protein (TIGR02543 family)
MSASANAGVRGNFLLGIFPSDHGGNPRRRRLRPQHRRNKHRQCNKLLTKDKSMKTKESVLKWLCLGLAVLTIQTAQSQSYTLNVVTNPPQRGTISGAGIYASGTGTICNIQATNGWYISDMQYAGSYQANQYPLALWNLYLVEDSHFGPFDFTTITNFSITIDFPPMLSDGTLTVIFASAAPAITTQPTNQIAITGRSVTLAEGVSGRQPMAYQWRFNGSNIAGATNSSLVFNAVLLTNTAAYTIVASNIFGKITNSVPSTLNVVDIGVFADGNFLTNKPYSAPNYSYIDLESLYPDGYTFYTLDGSDPDFTGTEYTGPFYIYNSCTVRAIAYSDDFSEYVEGDPAVIRILPSYQLKLLTYGGGTVSVNPPGENGQYGYGYYSYGDFLSNTVVTLVATPSSGSSFMGWSGALQGNNPTNTITINQSASIQAIFGTSLNPTNIGNGTVSIHPAASVYPYGFNVQVSAIPSPGACLVQWRDAATGSQNPLNLTMATANATITGIFAPLPTSKVSLTVISDGGGYVIVNPSANIYLQGTTNVLTAVANSGQNFIGWSGDATNTTNVISVVMDKSKSITAHFSHNFSQKFMKTGANLQFSISGGVSGDSYQLLTSTNLSTWTPMATNVDFYEPVLFFDSIDKTVPYRFYKTVGQ